MFPDGDVDIWYLGAWKENGKYTEDDSESAFDLIENKQRKTKGSQATAVDS